MNEVPDYSVQITGANEALSDLELSWRTAEFSPDDGIGPMDSLHQAGDALVAVAEIWARERGCRAFASDAPLENSGSHAMHLALGFEETERVVFFRKAVAQ